MCCGCIALDECSHFLPCIWREERQLSDSITAACSGGDSNTPATLLLAIPSHDSPTSKASLDAINVECLCKGTCDYHRS